MKVITHSDGGARKKTEAAGCGAVVYDTEGNELEARGYFLQGVTVPQTEYIGLIQALELARGLGATEVEAFVDAELIARHISGDYVCRSPKLIGLYRLTLMMMATFERCEVREFPKAGPSHKRRHGNERADALANSAMDARTNIIDVELAK